MEVNVYLHSRQHTHTLSIETIKQYHNIQCMRRDYSMGVNPQNRLYPSSTYLVYKYNIWLKIGY
jgi:hypothetical protein